MVSGMHNSEMSELWLKTLEQDLFPGQIIVEIGRSFLDAPYRAGTLETTGKEKLVINLAQFDCTTFVETVLALAHCAVAGNLSPAQFRKNLKFIRYRQGKIDGYASRLHYFTDWLCDNEKKKVLNDVSRLLVSGPRRKKINFMTTHHESYAGLKNEAAFKRMQQVERNVSSRVFYIIGRDKIARFQTWIHPGDIIAFATDQEGLDVAHVGFAVRQGRHLHLLHASSKESAVVVSKKTLSAYLKSNKNFTGIIVARFS